MAQPVWNTPAGTLLSPYTLSASAVSPATTITYSLITGSLPSGLSLSSAGVISGTATAVAVDTASRFTLRVTDDLGNFRDRSFVITITAGAAPQLVLPSYSSLLVTADNTWVSYQVGYSNPSTTTAYFLLTAGALPSGLEIDSTGLIRGYAASVTADTSYQFTLQVINSAGSASATYSITVTSSALKYPSLVNSQPTSFTPAPSDPYSAYYTTTDATVFTGSISTLSTSSFTGSISGTTLTVTSVTTPPVVGQLLTGTGVTVGTTITGVTVPATAYAIVTITSTATDFTIQLSGVPVGWVVGTQITIDGTTPAAYNADWIIASVVNSTTFTVNSVLNPGTSTVNGTARSYGTNIVGLYDVAVSQTVASTALIGFYSELSVTAVSSGTIALGTSFSGTSSTSTTAGSFIVGQPYTITSLGTTNYVAAGAPSATFDASLSGYTLTVTNVTTGTVAPGQDISGVAATSTLSGSFIVGQLYTITSSGTTDFVALGAGSNAVGTVFTATGTGYVPATALVVGLQYTIAIVGSTNFTLCGAPPSPGIATVFVATAVGTGSGYAIQGTGTAAATIQSGTTIIGYGTGAGGLGTYTVDVGQSLQTITGVNWTTTPNIGLEFTATTVGAGTGTAAPTIPSGTVVTSLVTGTGGTGTYGINSALTVPSTTITASRSIGNYYFGEYFSFKLIGIDWNSPARPLIYSAVGLPAGLTLDPNTGWVSGTITAPVGLSMQTYTFNAWVVNDLGYSSAVYTYSITMSTGVTNEVTWVTAKDLGTINNSTISELSVAATAGTSLSYRVVGGTLPPNLYLNSDGELYGRVAYQPSTATLPVGTTTPFTFKVEAYDPTNPVLRSSTREFTLTVLQKWSEPLETLYMRGTGDINDRTALNTLLSNAVIPDAWLYRANDPYWGRATGVTYNHTYGIYSSQLADYTAALTENYYNRQLTLGELKTAVARDSTGKIIYEVVYSSVIDDLINSTGTSVSKLVEWPYPVTLSNGTVTQYLYPASTDNMREQLTSVIGREIDTAVLPAWMTSQQRNGSTLGYTRAWVLCYTLPGYSDQVVANINSLWSYSLNKINFTVDRFTVDKSATFNYDSSTSTWSNLPSAQSVTCDIVATCAPGTLPNEITAQVATAAHTIENWYVGMPLKFTGTPFGGLQNNVVYYVSTLNVATNTFTVSASLNVQTAVLYAATGLMTGVPVYPAPTPTDSKDIQVLFQRATILSR